jgi:hypothetical protein
VFSDLVLLLAGSHTIDEEKDPEADYSIREQKLLSQVRTSRTLGCIQIFFFVALRFSE